MNLQQLSRLFVSVVLFAACVVLVLLAQAQSGGGGQTLDPAPNKCHTEWDFCNAGSEAENAYHWRLGWCVAAVESGAASVSVSACMGQEEGTVSYPRSLSPASLSSSSSMPKGADPNKCYTEWDFCNSGTEAENAYFWRLGWYSAAEEQGEVSVSLYEFMGGQAPTAVPTRGAPQPEVSPDLPWSREICWAMGLGRQCGWYVTNPPGEHCAQRSSEPPFECTKFRRVPPGGPVDHMTSTANAAATSTAGG